ncbi:MAG TPA: hypothetical protein VFD63_05825, partial [Pyrinomonadaceae bacterium]|nr:hypothetical protein [Pyrinomonadaceae bacterium]
ATSPNSPNPTARPRVVPSSPFYPAGQHPRTRQIPQRGSVWILQVLSTNSVSNLELANPTARQRVDRSSPFYSAGV